MIMRGEEAPTVNNNAKLEDPDRGSSYPALLKDGVGELSPASFAMVMATGIVSIAAHLMGLSKIAVALFWLNIVAYVVLAGLTALRAAWFPHQVFDDLRDHQRAPGFLTIVAGSCVLGSQYLLIANEAGAAFALWVIGAVLWLGLNYAIVAALTVKETKPKLDEGINGAWLLAVVAPQSVAVLGALLAAQGDPAYRLELNFVALCLWLLGGMLYIWLMALIVYRLIFFRLAAADLAPSYWINMGATAISTLAGSLLVLTAPGAPLLESLLPFVKGFTLLYWITGTWWIPALVILTLWRHAWKRFPITYDRLYWSAVFPLGMYAASTFQMNRALNLPFLDWVPHVFLYIAIVAWLAVFSGLVYTLTRRVLAVGK